MRFSRSAYLGGKGEGFWLVLGFVGFCGGLSSVGGWDAFWVHIKRNLGFLNLPAW